MPAMTQTDSDRTIALAEQALGQIKALKLPGDPQSYEIWYTYVAGTRPKLNAHINDILARRETLSPAAGPRPKPNPPINDILARRETPSPADLDQIYYQFFSQARVAEHVEIVGAKIQGEVDQIVAMIEAAIGASTQYQNELEDSGRKLALPIDRDTLRVIGETPGFR